MSLIETVKKPAIAVTRTVGADMLTPLRAYAALATPAASCLLESVESGGRISRYSFLGIDYLATTTFESDASMLDRIRSFVRDAVPQSGDVSLGGALLAFSYDAARPFARLAPRTADVPTMPDAYVAVPATWLIFDHFSDRVTIWTCGYDESALQTRIDTYLGRLLESPTSLPQRVRASRTMAATMKHDQYLTRVHRIKQYILDGEVYQLQLGIRFSAELDGTPLDLYRALRSRNPSPYMFYVDGPFGQILGASPEFLVRLDGRTARIRPLAGTRSRGATPAEDAEIAQELLSNEKERAEHVMLVDLGRNDLGAVCETGSVKVEELLQIERYSHVMHIVSDLSGRLRENRDALDLFAAGFPAGTVTGTPKVRAMQLIDELEPQTRGFYAGSVGRLSYSGDFDSCISLRCVHVVEGRAYWQASAGIVADSDPQAEYEEVLQKTRIAREVLGIQ